MINMWINKGLFDLVVDVGVQPALCVPDESPPAVMSAQPPCELTLAVKAVSGLFIYQPPALLRTQFLLKLQGVRLLPQSIFVPDLKHKRKNKCL